MSQNEKENLDENPALDEQDCQECEADKQDCQDDLADELNKVKEDSMEALKNEKTINVINSRRDMEQQDVNNVINGKY